MLIKKMKETIVGLGILKNCELLR